MDYALSVALRMTVFIRIITSRDLIITSVDVVQFVTFVHFVNTTTTWIMEFPGVSINLNFQSFRPYVIFKASKYTGALSVVWGYLVL